jgi:F-type H+-transporting ATPase subunit delta
VADPVRELLEATEPVYTAARGSGTLGQVADELFDVAAVLSRELRLRRALADPALPAEVKRALVGDLFGRMTASTRQLLDTVVAGGVRLSPGQLVEAIEQLGARAMFTQADVDGTLDDVEDQLYRFSRLVAREHGLRAALADPALPGENKLALVDDLLAARADPVTLRLVRHVVQVQRGRTVERATEALARQAAAFRGRVIAEVTSARPMDDDQVRRLGDVLSGVEGHPVRVQVVVDPSIIGGAIVRIGDRIIDGSVRRQLERARADLA